MATKTDLPKKATVKKIPKKDNKKKKKVNYKRRRKIAAAILLAVTIGVLFILVLFSDLFNTTKIIVINNTKVSTEEIIQKSGLKVNENMFKTFKSKIKESIKTNPYVEEVTVSKKLNGEVTIDIQEREPTYMLFCEGGYAYIDNQGYILEITENPLNLPIIKGYATKEIKLGNRLEREDLEKLDTVIQIMETAKSKSIKDIITAIDITDKNNFILEIPSEKKTVQFGDSSNINVKILWIVDIIGRTKDEEGEIIVKSSDTKKAYFREKV